MSILKIIFKAIKIILIIAGIIYFINYFNNKTFSDKSIKTIVTTTATDLINDSHVKDIIKDSTDIKNILPNSISEN